MSQIPETDRSTKVVKTFQGESQPSSILGLNWNIDTDSLIVCRGTEQEVPAKFTQKIVLCLSSVRPTWDMFSLHKKNAVPTQKQLAAILQAVINRTLKTVQ